MPRRSVITFVIFNDNNTSLKPIVESLRKFDYLTAAKLELCVVVKNKSLSHENEQDALSLRRTMKVRIMDYNEDHDENDLKYYGHGKFQIKKIGSDVITQDELNEYFKKDMENHNIK